MADLMMLAIILIDQRKLTARANGLHHFIGDFIDALGAARKNIVNVRFALMFPR
jgi:hypothetical protein